jgi:hypothetical protein
MLEKLSPRQLTYVAARVRGSSKAEACRQAGCAPDTGAGWEKAPWWTPAADRERRTYFGDKHEQLIPVVNDALARIKDEIAGRHGDDLAHASAVYVLDQAWGKAQSNIKQEVTGESGIGGTLVEVLRALSEQRRQAELDAPQASVVEALPAPQDSPAVDAESATFESNPEA